MKTFLYLRGNPGTGKITVGRLLEQKLGWRLFWFHDLKNTVYAIVKEHRIPRIMDAITVPIIEHLLKKGESIIYVRPSPDKETVENIAATVKQFPGYTFKVVRLTAEYDVLHHRVTHRVDPFRVTTKEALDEYINGRTMADIEGEYIIATDNLTPEEVMEKIVEII